MGRLSPVELVVPSEVYLAGYVAALRLGWSADNVRGAAAAREELGEIERDAAAFLRTKADDRAGKGPPVKLPDGSVARRLPGFVRWIWDGAFCGSIGFRWQPGTAALPAHVLGHIGYAVVPWKRGRGYATRALCLMLDEARAEGLAYVELTTDLDNPASQRVILANGGRLIERFEKPAQYGSGLQSLRYRIVLAPSAV
jgi:predicted acetyltransferase